MLNIKYIVACALLMPILASCATRKGANINSNTLIKLPNKMIVKNEKLYLSNKSKDLFDKEQTNLELSFIHQTPTPIWIPPIITNVLIMPYVDSNNNLHSYQYAYIKLQQGKWLIGNYLSKQKHNKIIEPLNIPSKHLKIKYQSPLNTQSSYNSKPHATTDRTTEKGYFQGGSAKSVDTSIPSSSNDNTNQQYFNNTLNSMKNGR